MKKLLAAAVLATGVATATGAFAMGGGSSSLTAGQDRTFCVTSTHQTANSASSTLLVRNNCSDSVRVTVSNGCGSSQVRELSPGGSALVSFSTTVNQCGLGSYVAVSI